MFASCTDSALAGKAPGGQEECEMFVETWKMSYDEDLLCVQAQDDLSFFVDESG